MVDETYVNTAFKHLLFHKNITHKEIQQETNCNDSYSVMEAIKKRLRKLNIVLYYKRAKDPATKKTHFYYWID